MIVLFGTVVHNLLEIPSISVCGLQSGDEIVFGWWGGGGGQNWGNIKPMGGTLYLKTMKITTC